jgi:hypothetical protein
MAGSNRPEMHGSPREIHNLKISVPSTLLFALRRAAAQRDEPLDRFLREQLEKIAERSPPR